MLLLIPTRPNHEGKPTPTGSGCSAAGSCNTMHADAVQLPRAAGLTHSVTARASPSGQLPRAPVHAPPAPVRSVSRTHQQRGSSSFSPSPWFLPPSLPPSLGKDQSIDQDPHRTCANRAITVLLQRCAARRATRGYQGTVPVLDGPLRLHRSISLPFLPEIHTLARQRVKSAF